MKRLCLLLPILLAACSPTIRDNSDKLEAARQQLAAGNDRAALSLLLEVENTPYKSHLSGKASFEIGQLYGRRGRPDLARKYFLRAFSADYIDLEGFSAAIAATPADTLQIPLSETEYDFRRQQFTAERIHLQHIVRISLYSAAAATVLFIGSFLYFRRRRKQETEHLLTLIDNLNDSTTSLLSELDDRKTQEKRLKALLSNRFAEVRGLTDTVYRYEHNPTLLHRKLRETLSLRTLDSTLFDDLEEVVDAYRNNLIRRLRTTYPALTKNELQFCALLSAGFSVQEICILLNIQSVQNVWMKKYRLKRKLALAAGMDVDTFLRDFAQVECSESKSPTINTDNQHIENDTSC